MEHKFSQNDSQSVRSSSQNKIIHAMEGQLMYPLRRKLKRASFKHSQNQPCIVNVPEVYYLIHYILNEFKERCAEKLIMFFLYVLFGT